MKILLRSEYLEYKKKPKPCIIIEEFDFNRQTELKFLIIGRPSSGKTTIARDIIKHNKLHKKQIVFSSTNKYIKEYNDIVPAPLVFNKYDDRLLSNFNADEKNLIVIDDPKSLDGTFLNGFVSNLGKVCFWDKTKLIVVINYDTRLDGATMLDYVFVSRDINQDMLKAIYYNYIGDETFGFDLFREIYTKATRDKYQFLAVQTVCNCSTGILEHKFFRYKSTPVKNHTLTVSDKYQSL